MDKAAEAWTAELGRWLAPFVERLAYPAQRHWAPLYIAGLLAPGERKSLEPLASRVAPGHLQQLHHFLSTSRWDPAPLEEELVRHAGVDGAAANRVAALRFFCGPSRGVAASQLRSPQKARIASGSEVGRGRV